MAESEVGIDLGRRDVGVAEEDLHAAEIGSVLDHVRGAAVAELMRAGGRVAGFDEMPDPLARELFAAFGEEEPRVTLLAAWILSGALAR